MEKWKQFKFLSGPSQGHQAPHCIQVYPQLANFPRDSFCSDLQQAVTVPVTQKHWVFPWLTEFQSIAITVAFAQLAQVHSESKLTKVTQELEIESILTYNEVVIRHTQGFKL